MTDSPRTFRPRRRDSGRLARRESANRRAMMATRRKTEAEPRQDQANAGRRVWEGFRFQLAGLKTLADAKVLVSNGPQQGQPGRSYYSNLGFFLRDFIPALGSNDEEKALYIGFIRRLV